MSRSVLLPLRILLVVLFVGCVSAQLAAGPVAATALDGGPFDAVLVGLVIAGLVCVEAVLVSTWMLLSMIGGDRIFDGDGGSDRWVDLAIGAFVAGAVVAAAGLVYVVSTVAAPLLALMLLMTVVVSASFALVVVVMPRLLHTAIQQHSDLAEVV